MNSLYALGVRQVNSLNADLQTMAESPEPSTSLQGQIAASLAALSRTIDDYDSMARKEMISAKQEKAMSRVNKFRDDFKRIRERLAMLKREQASVSASTARSSLLGGDSLNAPQPSTSRFRSSISAQSSSSPASSSSSSSINRPSSPTYDSPFSYRPNNPRPNQYASSNGGLPNHAAANMREHSLREESFASQAESQLDLLIEQGRGVLGSLVEQRGWLKGTRKRLLDAANGVKGGRQVVGWVERRSKQDTVIFFVGAITTLVCFALIWWYLG